MLVDRQELLGALDACQPGLASKEVVEQSTCFAFSPGFVTTFNDSIMCRHDVPLQVTGAVPARPLLEFLRKSSDDAVTITVVGNEFRIKGSKSARACLNLNPDILLPTGCVAKPSDWVEVPPAFADAIALASRAAHQDLADEPALGCVLIEPDRVVACDRLQLVMHHVNTGLTTKTLIPAFACKAVNGLGIAEVADTESWCHWKTYTGLTVSLRKSSCDYPSGLEAIFGTPEIGKVLLPSVLSEVISRTAPFLDNKNEKKVGIKVKTGKIMVHARNNHGWYEEVQECDYSGPDFSFYVQPKYFEGLLSHDVECGVTEDSIRLVLGSFKYAVSINKA